MKSGGCWRRWRARKNLEAELGHTIDEIDFERVHAMALSTTG